MKVGMQVVLFEYYNFHHLRSSRFPSVCPWRPLECQKIKKANCVHCSWTIAVSRLVILYKQLCVDGWKKNWLSNLENTLMHSWVTLTLDLSDCYFCINEKTKLLSLQVWRRQWFTSNVHGSPFLFFDIRGDATGKLAGIGKNVNDESCSTRRALLHTNFHSKQLKTRGARCPIYWFFWHFLSLWPCDFDLGTKMKNRVPWGYACAIGRTKYRNHCQIRQTPSEKM